MSVCADLSSANKKIVANATIFCFIGQRSVASCSANGNAARHSRYRFADSVPLHYTPRTGRTAFPLSVRGQRSVASYSANRPYSIPVIGSRTAFSSHHVPRATFRCIMFRANARRRHGGARRTHHSSTVKVDPLPGVLSTEMLPPQSLHMRWQMASPSPLPAPGFA